MKLKIYLLLLFMVAVINFLPLMGLFSAAQLSQAYGVVLGSQELEVLMRHRALLFGILGGFMFFALFKPQWQVPAMVMTGVSMLGFVFLIWITGDINDELMKITLVDVAGIICLLSAVCMKSMSTMNKKP